MGPLMWMEYMLVQMVMMENMLDQMKSMLEKVGLEDLGLRKSMLLKEDWKGTSHSGKFFPCQS